MSSRNKRCTVQEALEIIFDYNSKIEEDEILKVLSIDLPMYISIKISRNYIKLPYDGKSKMILFNKAVAAWVVFSMHDKVTTFEIVPVLDDIDTSLAQNVMEHHRAVICVTVAGPQLIMLAHWPRGHPSSQLVSLPRSPGAQTPWAWLTSHPEGYPFGQAARTHDQLEAQWQNPQLSHLSSSFHKHVSMLRTSCHIWGSYGPTYNTIWILLKPPEATPGFLFKCLVLTWGMVKMI